MVGVEYRRIIWRFKNRPHIYIFLTKIFYGFETVFLYYDFGILPDMRVLCRAKILPQIYMRIIASLKPPPYIHALYTRKISPPQIYIRIAVRLESVGDWSSVGILAFVCIMFCMCGHRLDKVVFVDWLMSKFDCKSVMGLHKFIVKMWLYICNCMCICVCIWYWL